MWPCLPGSPALILSCPAALPDPQLNISLANRDSRWHCERAYTETFAGGR